MACEVLHFFRTSFCVSHQAWLYCHIAMDDQSKYDARAKVAKALAHPTRLYVLDLLQERERSVTELTESVGSDQSTVSKHLSILREVHLVTCRKEGTTVYYGLCCPCIDGFFACLESVVRSDVCHRQTALQ